MQHEQTQSGKRLYKVEVGHNSVVVESASQEDAIRAARTKLSLELPRLWDIIQQLGPEKFKVSLVY
jgi:hypothetical protein